LSKLGLSEKNQNFRQIEGAFVGSYIHSGNIATLVALSKKIEGAEEVARNVSMQAMSPIALDESGVAAIEKKLKSQRSFAKKENQKQC
jgi:elongation factor Ts